MTEIAVFVGSLRSGSLNNKLAHNLEKLAPEGVRFNYVDLNLPLYNADVEEANYPESAQKAKDIVAASDGVLIVTPEYNRSVPGVLKNTMDWISRPHGTNSFDGKPLALAGASGGPIGTAVAQSDLRHIAGYLNMRLLGQPELYFNLANDKFDENGQVVDEYKGRLENYMQSFVDFVQKH
ncbi:MAG: NADPH-dependent reductase [Candidatus Saccharibacteria bacterium]|nr:NADPH-dependent reductase [Candidatus Saccharibacteria bacterium]